MMELKGWIGRIGMNDVAFLCEVGRVLRGLD